MSEDPNVEGIDAKAASETQDVTIEVSEEQREESAVPQNPKEDDLPSDDDGNKVQKGVQKRIDELTREKYERDRRIRELENRLFDNIDKQQPQTQQKQPGPPNPEDFSGGRFDPDYQKAIVDYEVKQAVSSALSERERAEQESRERESMQKFSQDLAKSEKAFIAEHPDYEQAKELIFSDPVFLNHSGIGEAVIHAENPAELIHYLGTHPDIAYQIAQLNPAAAARRLGIIEATFSKHSAATTKPASKAPAPINPIGGGGANVGNTDPAKAKSMEEYKRLRLAQQKS